MRRILVGGRRIVLGHAYDVRQTASLFAADPLSVIRIINALDSPSRECGFDRLVAAAIERVRRHFSSRSHSRGNKYARVAYAWLKQRNWRLLGIPRRTFFHALRKIKDFFEALKTRVKSTFSSSSPSAMLHSNRDFRAVSEDCARCAVETKKDTHENAQSRSSRKDGIPAAPSIDRGNPLFPGRTLATCLFARG